MKPDRNQAYAIAFMVAALMMFLGSVFFAYRTWESYSSAGWPHVQGIILSSHTERTCGTKTHTWEAKISYQYSVAGESYTGNRVSNSAVYCDSDRDTVITFLRDNYPVGKIVDVYYNPTNPAAAFLHPGVVSILEEGMIVVTFIIGAIMGYGAKLYFRLSRIVPTTAVRRTVKFTIRLGKLTQNDRPREGE